MPHDCVPKKWDYPPWSGERRLNYETLLYSSYNSFPVLALRSSGRPNQNLCGRALDTRTGASVVQCATVVGRSELRAEHGH